MSVIPVRVPLVRSATAAELLRAGTSTRGIRALVDAGELHRVGRGIYRESSDSRQETDPFTAARQVHIESATAWTRAFQGAYLVGPSACIAHGLPLMRMPKRVHLAREPRLQSRRGEVVGRRSWPHSPPVLSPHLGVYLQPVAAAIVETAALGGTLAGLIPADAALHADKSLALNAELRRWGRRGGVARVRAMCAVADGRRESPLETRTAWQAYEAGYELVPQVVIRDGGGGWVARVDFVVQGLNVIVEADGVGKYRSHIDFKAERVRHNLIEELGWIVVRVCDEDLRYGRFIPRLAAAVSRARPDEKQQAA